MVSLWKYALCFTLTVFLLPSVFAIKCFDCKSKNDPKCAEPFDNSTVPITTCDEEKGLPAMCRKVRRKVNGEWQYSRDCAYLGEDGVQGDGKFCSLYTDSNNVLTEYCTCNTKDGCNSSSQFLPIPIFIAFLGTLPYVAFKQLF